MKQAIPIAIRAAFTFVALTVIAFKIPYYLLMIGGLAAGLFVWKTSDDRALSLGIVIGSILFGIFEFIYGQV
jgi:hypothetical protein